MPALRLFLLGSLDIRHDGQQLPKPPTLKSQSLLAYLALHRQPPQPRERLADLFWGDRPERRARRSLTTALWHIRRCLPADEDWLLSDVHSAQLDPQADLWLDVAEFESLVARPELSCLASRRRAVPGRLYGWLLRRLGAQRALPAGDAVLRSAGAVDGGPGSRRRRRTARWPSACGCCSTIRCARTPTGWSCAPSVAWGSATRPWSSTAAASRSCKQELEAEPMAETAELYQAILDGRFEVGPAGGDSAVVAKALRPSRRATTPWTPSFVARWWAGKPRWPSCTIATQQARAGHGGLVLVSGEAGVGKTRLVEELADHLRWQGVRVLWGRCYEFERLLPYQPVGEALQAVLRPWRPAS